MIPIKLQLKNFLSYGSELQEIDFSRFNLICLSGKNGHGKSALLDAMTWAIWGAARKVAATAKPEQGLLRLGQRQMVVIFDFIFNGQNYRVRREYTNAYGKSYAYLDFGVTKQDDSFMRFFDEAISTFVPKEHSELRDTNNFISLTGKTIKETQEKIISVLGFDYDAFVNSAFLRQGQSNEFSKKSPKDRKEILCSILGLQKFENLKKLAFDKARTFVTKKEMLEGLQQRIEQELKQIEVLNAENLNTTEEIKSITNYEIDFFNQLKEAENSLKDLSKEIQECKIITFKHQELVNKSNDIEKQALELYKLFRSVNAKLNLLKNKQNLECERQRLASELQTFQAQLEKLLKLKDKQLILKETEQKTRLVYQTKSQELINKCKFDLDKMELKHANLSEKFVTINDHIAEINKKLLNLKAQQKTDENKIINVDLKALEKKFEHKKEFYHYVVNLGNSLKAILNDLINKKNLVSSKTSSCCPLCTQPLNDQNKKTLHKDFENQEQLLKVRLERIKRLIPVLKEYLIVQHEDIKKINLINIDLQQLAKEIADSELALKQLEKDKSEIIDLIDQLNKDIKKSKSELKKAEKEAENILTHDTEYQKVLFELNETGNTIDQIGYSEQKHSTLKANLANIELELKTIEKLNEEKILQKERMQKIFALIHERRICKKEVIQLSDLLETLKNVYEKEKLILTKIEEIKTELKSIALKKETLMHKRGSIEAQRKKLDELAVEHKQNAENILLIEKEIQDYKDLASMLSKDGIQALLIEEAIPEIEQEANNLLSRLTDNQAQIFIESLRDLKKGGTKETLDIKISDSAGIRDYEMFSGGEAFRIDFALRIAISKLLARRAGTSLQTLIIDEGFGSQDDEGLANIMDAIYKIQEDFEKVIIVSHLPSMKDQFPVHFFVKKGADGSQVQVVEQG